MSLITQAESTEMVSQSDKRIEEEFLVWVRQILKPGARNRNIRPDVLDVACQQITFRRDVLERQASQKEFVLPIWEYLDIAASDARIRNGRKMLRMHRDLFNRIEQRFGVEAQVVAAIWGLESGYGKVKGDIPTLSALATLAFRGRRADFFEAEFAAALRVVQLTGLAPGQLVGSWAGAMGHGQFMPSAVLEFGVDFDRDGRIDLFAKDPTDALASIANYLARHGWTKGQPWGLEIHLPEGFDYALTGAGHVRPVASWSALGVRTADGGRLPGYGPGFILLPAGAGGVPFLALRNFSTIMRYNHSEAYALGIGLLADRIGGGKPLQQAWPKHHEPITQDDIREIQLLLTGAGFDTMGIDGLNGPDTMRAAQAFQLSRGLLPDGYLGHALLLALKAVAKEPPQPDSRKTAL